MQIHSTKEHYDYQAMRDRRAKRRFDLRCPVSIQRKAPDISEFPNTAVGETVNVSSLGFYGIVDKEFNPGERLDCELKLPASSAGFTIATPKLKCNAVVLRVEPISDNQFGVACMITNYAFSAAVAE